MAQILVKNLPFMKFAFDDVVDWHIHTKGMCEKSGVVSSLVFCLLQDKTQNIMRTLNIPFILSQVPLGVQLKDEVKHEDMIEIIFSFQQYVPMVYTAKKTVQSNAEEVMVEFYLKLYNYKYEPLYMFYLQIMHDVFQQILFGGDQLNLARVRGSQQIHANSELVSEMFTEYQKCLHHTCI